MYKLTEQKVKSILRHKNEKLKDIREKRIQLYEMIADTDSVITSIALPSPELSELPTGKGNHRDMGDVLMKYQAELRKRNQELRSILWQLSEEEEGIIRTWTCFCALPDPYYGILKALYVDNQLYQTVEQDFGHSHKTFEQYRKRGIDSVIRYYESEMSVSRLLEEQNRNQKHKNKSNKNKRAGMPGQMKLTDMLQTAEDGELC